MPDILDRLQAALADRYAIERELGSGGMATVYLAEDLKHRRNVAIKVLSPELAAAIGSDRFLREIEIVARLHHPHILPLYDSGDADGLLYYVMPYIEGESLRHRLNREKQLPQEDALQIAREVADALSSAHSQDVVHRDIKPENILLEQGHAVVADFGIARAISAARGESLTETGMAVGTPDYMSPEQASGGEVDGRSDLYSLGTVLHEMLAGEPPFTGPTVESVVHQHLSVQAPSVTTLRPAIPADVASAVQRALAKSPADRYVTASQFADTLKQVISGPVAVRPPTRRLPVPLLAGIGLVLVVGAIGIWLSRTPSGAGMSGRPRLAVLPFENLGPPDDEYFADGITEEITSRLARVSGLEVIARTSAMQYKGTDKGANQIGEELNVEYLLEGTVRWSKAGAGGSRVRVSPQLIQVSDEAHLWAEPYEEVLADIFQVQVDIAEQVATALDVTLLGPERQALAARPTENLEAYDLYLRGNDYLRGVASEENYRIASQMYERALELDSSFALAAARLSVVHARMYWYYYDRTTERLDIAKRAVDQALAVAPDLPEAHIALGEFYYRAYLDYDRALQELEIARSSLPNDSELLEEIGAIQRRRGDWEQGAATLVRASELEPRSASLAVQAGHTYINMRDYEVAEQHFVRAMSLAPDVLRPYVWLAFTSLTWKGDTARVRALLGDASRVSPTVLDPQTSWHWAMFRVLDGAAPAAFDRLTRLSVDTAFYYSAMAELHGLNNDARLERVYYDSARVVLEQRVEQLLGESRFHGQLGVAYAGLGRTADAIREAKQAAELLPVSRDGMLGPDWVQNLARVYVMVGEHDAAVEQLEYLLSIPSRLSVHWLRLDPIWAPLRGHPGFEQLIAN